MKGLDRLEAALRSAGYPEHAVGVAARAKRHGLPLAITADGVTVHVGHSEVEQRQLCAWLDDDTVVATCDGFVVDPGDTHLHYRSIRVPNTWWRALAELGDGNASHALRTAISEYLQRQGRML